MKPIILFTFYFFLFTSLTFAQTSKWRLIWDKNTEDDMAYYRIFRSESSGASTEIDTLNHKPRVGDDTTMTFIDGEIAPLSQGVRYYYRVKAVDQTELESDYSAEVSAAIPSINVAIPDQSIFKNENFNDINFDNYLNDPDHADNLIKWKAAGNVNLTVNIQNRILSIIRNDTSWTGIETITFTATDPDSFFDEQSVKFTVLDEVQKFTPVVSEIPDQTIRQGESFATINLDSYVIDQDNADSEIDWTYSGNTNLSVNVNANRVATISPPDTNWTGSESITFTATDPDDQSDSDQATFTVQAKAGPIVSDIPDQTIQQGENFATISLDNYIQDPDHNDDQITWSFSGNTDLAVNINANRVATISKPTTDWVGSETILFRANDPDNLFDEDEAKFTVSAANVQPVVSGIPDQTIQQGQNFSTISLDNYVLDPDHNDNLMTWSFSGNTDLIVNINVNRVAIISKPNANWVGSETITFRATDPDGLFDEDGATFTVTAANLPPEVSDIPDQTIKAGQSFSTITLDNYVDDPDHNDDQMIWSISGNADLAVNISANREATITTPNSNWTGMEDIIFRATDPEGLSDTDTATFKVEMDTIQTFDEVTAFPVPFRLEEGAATTITFTNLPVAGKIFIYDLLGNPLIKIDIPSATHEWDVKNQAGKDINSGVYLYIVKDADGNKKHSGKLIVVR